MMAAADPEPVQLEPSRRMRMRFQRDVESALGGVELAAASVFHARDLAPLPAVVQRYLRFMGVPGRTRTRSFRAHWAGSFRMGPDKPWMPCEVWQLNLAKPVTRIFHMRVRFGGVVPVYVRDTYVAGEGRMRARVLNAFDIVDEHDERITTGELVTYLNDALLFAPSMLLVDGVRWAEVDSETFDVTLQDRGKTVTGRVTVDARGALVDFSTIDRFGNDPADPKQMVRARWTTPVAGWREVGGQILPTRAEAIWHFPSCEFAYATFDFDRGKLELDVRPGRSAR